jgi:hypothetical protein
MSVYQHPDCYARSLGGCSTKISLEHYVSEGILKLIDQRFGVQSETVDGTNLVSLKPCVKKKLTIGRLTAPILCETHNSRLAPFDTEGLAMFAAMDKMNEYGLNPQLPAPTARIDGDRFERWMLKTLCGCLYSGNIRLPEGVSNKGICPSAELLDILFNGASFPDRLGLHYIYGDPGELIEADPMILKYGPLLETEGDVVTGLQVWFFGFRFILLTERLRPGVFTVFDQGDHRPAGLDLAGTNACIQFDWKNGSGSPALRFKCLGARPGI